MRRGARLLLLLAILVITTTALLVMVVTQAPTPKCREGYVYVPQQGICTPGYRP